MMYDCTCSVLLLHNGAISKERIMFMFQDFTYSCFIVKEIVPLRKVCHRPETDYRLQQLHAVHEAAPVGLQKTGMDPVTVYAIKVTTSAETQKQQNANIPILT